MTTFCPSILMIIASTLSLSCAPSWVQGASSVADSYPVMVEDGESNYLILNDDEVANSQFLKLFPGASKEEVEELVDSSPQIQDMILDKIKMAVEKRKKSKSLASKSVNIEKPSEPVKLIEVDPPGEQIIHIVHHNSGDKTAYLEEEDNDDDSDIDDIKVAKMRAKLKMKAAKVFKIGAKMKAKLMKFVRKKDKKKAKKTQNGRFPRPHFRYKVTTINDE